MSDATGTVPCAHCGQPAPPAQGPAFCCVGCEAVYTALHGEGLETFYALREVAPGTGQTRPAAVSEGVGAGFDAPTFLDRHSRACDDGAREIDLYLDGVHCAGCVWLVERMPHALDGVTQARLDLPRARLHLRWDQDARPLSEIARWLARFGYSAHPLRGQGVADRSAAERSMLIRVGMSWALAGNVMLLAAALYAGLDLTHEPQMAAAARWASLVLTAASVWVGGRTFLARAGSSMVAAWQTRGRALLTLSMDVPISLGILVGWGHSAWATVTGQGEVWFDSVAVLIAALLTARWLQVRGRRAAGDASDRLMALLPTLARRLVEAGVEEIEAEALEVGDVVEVRAGEIFPADGEVIEGVSQVHRGVLTGESAPERVGVGQRVHAGATNVGSVLRVRVEASGDETRVGRLLKWIEQESQDRAPVVQLADRWSGFFVAAVLLASVGTALGWLWFDPSQAVAHTVALLVVSCPCALGMATPLALTVAVGRAARQGIFIKHDDVIEQLSGVTHVVLDKTGTLTLGRMSVVEVRGSDEAVALAAALEHHSAHPIAAALRREAEGTNRHRVEEAREVPGAGMEGLVDGARLKVGRPDWVLSPGDPWQAQVDALTAQGRTPVAIAVDDQVQALVGLGDPLRPEAREVIAALRARGVTAALLSGDHPEVVAQAGAQLGLDPQMVHGGVSPEDKRAFIQALCDPPGRVVMMVGDGVNDAAALQAAHIGVAVHGGAEASLVASDIFVTRPGLAPIQALIEGADEALHVIRRNIGASLLYNVAGVSLAALGMVSPLLAAVAMPISSLGVVVSSLAQRSFAPSASSSRIQSAREPGLAKEVQTTA